ncbi:MAG TPA: amino acid permease, partial [Bacteroidia bacterium]|nr:amino acid permease [Bacteroidia bacterium]
MSARKINLHTAVFIVIANMIGTGVFVSLGYQLDGIQSGFAIIMLWLLGGVIALCGALSYGELASAMPRSGGEYHYLTQIFHPLLGFLSGWISVTVGFAAPVALAAIALSDYVAYVYPSINPLLFTCAIVVLITIVHSFTLKRSAVFQDVTTVMKIALIVFFVIAGLMMASSQHISLMPVNSSIKEQSWTSIFTAAFAVSLNWIYFAYSGWNASAYIANDMENPKVNIPKSLLYGTLIVTVLYVLINYVFMNSAPIDELKKSGDGVAYVSAVHIFGANGGKIMAILIAVTLVSTVSSMIFIGPRVAQVMGEDMSQLSFLAKKNDHGVPVIATVVQSAITIMLVTFKFTDVLVYAGFTLNLMTFLTVLGLFVMRIKGKIKSDSYKTIGYPVTPFIFLILSAWTLYFTMSNKPIQSLLGLATILA